MFYKLFRALHEYLQYINLKDCHINIALVWWKSLIKISLPKYKDFKDNHTRQVYPLAAINHHYSVKKKSWQSFSFKY